MMTYPFLVLRLWGRVNKSELSFLLKICAPMTVRTDIHTGYMYTGTVNISLSPTN